MIENLVHECRLIFQVSSIGIIIPTHGKKFQNKPLTENTEQAEISFPVLVDT